MKVGRAWNGVIKDVPVRVEYTKHFVDRFREDEGDRPAVERYVDEPEILEVIKDALPEVVGKWKGIWDHSGVVTSRGRDLNMSFVTDTDNDGMKMVMMNMMLKSVYRSRPNDYVFAVAGAKDPELSVAVASKLASMGGARRAGRIETPEAIFSVVEKKNGLRVSGASWIYDTYVYRVR